MASCLPGNVLEGGICLTSCPVGKRSLNGVCVDCPEGICNTFNEFFDVRKVAPNTVEVTQTKEVLGLATPLSSNFV